MDLIPTTNLIFSLLTIISQIIIGIIIFLLIFRQENLFQIFNKKSILFAFFVSLVATLGSLFYSEVIGFKPCKLCWFQRIFMYPQVILLGLAFLNKDKSIFRYILPMSIIGLLIALYHYLLQIGFVSGSSCNVVGYSASCSQRFTMNFGYITIPMMSLTAFSFIIILSAIDRLNDIFGRK